MWHNPFEHILMYLYSVGTRELNTYYLYIYVSLEEEEIEILVNVTHLRMSI